MPAGPGEQTWIASKPPVGERLHRGGQAGDADPQARVEGHVDLGHRGQPPVDLGVGADDLDLEARARRAARISSIVRVTPCVEPIPSARIATRGRSPSSSLLAAERRRPRLPSPSGIAASLACSLARNAVAGA